MGLLIYKDFKGDYEFQTDDHTFVGKITNIKDLVTFESDTEHTIENSFQSAVDDYIETRIQVDGIILSSEEDKQLFIKSILNSSKKQFYTRDQVKDLLIKFGEEIHLEYNVAPRCIKFIQENLT